MLIEKVRETVFGFLETMAHRGPSLQTFDPNSRDRDLLEYLLKSGIITREEVRDFMHEVLIKAGRSCYERHRELGTAPDHLHPEAFAYAISNDEFSYQELQGVRFDHSDTPSSFVQTYRCADGGRKLLDQLVENILEPKKQPPFTLSDSEVCC